MRHQNADMFWWFMREREAIRLRRLEGLPREEWTNDETFKSYSFTNVKRVHDRTTALLKEEFYDKWLARFGATLAAERDLHPCREALLNAAIFRYHGKIETARAIGWTDTWNRAALINITDDLMDRRIKVFTAAYIIPNCGITDAKNRVVCEIIDGIYREAAEILDTNSWAEACHRLCRLHGVGSFMAKEVLLDYILATDWMPDDWTTWTPVGPGGRRGAGYVKYDEVSGIDEGEALDVIRDLYAERDAEWPSTYVPLDITDVQFQLCELAKYMKAERGYGRPKRKFRPTMDHITVRKGAS